MSQCNAREVRDTFPGESEQPRYGVTHLFFSSPVQCFRVSIPPTVKPTLLRQIDIESLTCAQIWVRAVHTIECGSGTNKSTQELTRRDRNTVPDPSTPGDRTQGLRIEFRLSSLTTELRPPSEVEHPKLLFWQHFPHT